MSMNNQKFSPKLFTSTTATPNLNPPISLIPSGSRNLLNATRLDADVVYEKDFLHSIIDSELHFTNYISKIKDSKIDDNIKRFADNPNIISNKVKHIDLDMNNGERIRKIISRATDERIINKYSDYIYESDLTLTRYILSERGTFRVFSIYAIFNIASDAERHVLIVCLLDPYHLVCPVKRGTISKQENMIKTFEQYRHYDSSFDKKYNEYFSTKTMIGPDEML